MKSILSPFLLSLACLFSLGTDSLTSLGSENGSKSFDPNVGLVMCGQGGASFNFDILGNGSVALAPKLKGLGNLHFEISTSSSEAQEFFNQGMKLVYGFNHA